MFEIYKFSEVEISVFALSLIRLSSFMVVLPVFGNRLVPASVKILLSLVMAMVMFPAIKAGTTLSPGWQDDIILLALRESVLGIFLGFLVRTMFVAVEIAGQLLGFSMGFSAVQLLNPTFGESSTMMEEFQTILGTLLYLSINGHHMFFEAIHKSFEMAPIGRIHMDTRALASVTTLVANIFIIAIKLAGPMIAVILFLNIALGMVGRAVPQINVFVISFPVNIMVGLFILVASIPLFMTVLEADFVQTGSQIFTYLKGF